MLPFTIVVVKGPFFIFKATEAEINRRSESLTLLQLEVYPRDYPLCKAMITYWGNLFYRNFMKG